MKQVKKSAPPKIVQRLNFSLEKQSLQRVVKDTPEGENIKISFGIDYQQKIWVAAATPEKGVGPSPFAQQLSFSIPRSSAISVLNEVRSGGSVRISFCISDDQKVWVTLSNNIDNSAAE